MRLKIDLRRESEFLSSSLFFSLSLSLSSLEKLVVDTIPSVF